VRILSERWKQSSIMRQELIILVIIRNLLYLLI